MEFDDPTLASRAVLIEVANVLGAFREHLVVVGGWVPSLHYPDCGHMGSIDVDLAIAPTAISSNAYQSVLKRMLDGGYQLHGGPTRFVKAVGNANVTVDLITGQYVLEGKSARVAIEELQVNSVRGIDLAFQGSQQVTFEGRMPDGAMNKVRVSVVLPEVFVLLKAFALDERRKEKDAYDVAFVLHHHQPDLAALADGMRPLLNDGLGREAYDLLKSKFHSLDAVGPTWAAKVTAETAGLDFEQQRRAAYEDAQMLFNLVE